MKSQHQPKKKRKIRALLALAVFGALIVSALIIFAVISASHAPVSTPTAPAAVTPHYLQYPSGSNSSIFLISATSTYGTYPFASVSSIPGGLPEIKKGAPCFIINATIRNDYTLENPPPNQVTRYYANGTSVNETASTYVFLTAQIYDKQGTIINATDVTPPYGLPNGGAYVYLNSGEKATLTIYLATSRQDIDHFEVIPKYIGAIAPP